MTTDKLKIIAADYIHQEFDDPTVMTDEPATAELHGRTYHYVLVTADTAKYGVTLSEDGEVTDCQVLA
ncbi:hypothetical protein BH10CHL1_BH10CHL1_10200 [soil metagenome]